MKIECFEESDTRKWHEGMRQHIEYFQNKDNRNSLSSRTTSLDDK